MKNNKFAKISLLVLSLALCVCAMFAMSVNAEGTQPEIVSQNVKYTDKFALMYAVKASTATAPVTLNVYNADPATGATPAKTYTTSEVVAPDGNLTVETYQFVTDGVAATKLTQLFYVQAVDANGNKSEVKRYSVAEYLYERLGSGEASAKQSAFYQSSIAFGTSAQKVIGKETDETKFVSNYRYVTVDGGTIDGFSAGVYPVGAELTVVKDNADNADQWKHCYYDSIGVFANETIEGSFTVKDSAKNILSLTDIDLPRLGIEDFEGFEAGSFAVNKGADSAEGVFRRPNTGNTAGVSYSFLNDATQGMVAKLNLYGYNYVTMLRRNNGIFSENEATAYECSFDLKVEMPRYKGFNETAIRLMWYGTDDVSYTQNYVYVKHIEDETGKVIGQELHSGTPYNDATRLVTMDENGWCNVRIVVYKGSNKVHFYFNGVKSSWTTTLSSGYTGDIASLAGIGFRIGEYTDSTDNNAEVRDTYVYLDDVFCGFTKEADPTAK